MGELEDKIILKAENIEKSFHNKKILQGVGLSVRYGEIVSFLGPSGSGKSTFLRCLNLLETPDKGKITIEGDEYEIVPSKGKLTVKGNKDIQKLRTCFGMVFQSFNLWAHMTILENITEAPINVLKNNKKESIEKAYQLLEKVGILDKSDSYPIQLSGGQKQRAAIARALAIEPKILLFDEPTSSLDPELVEEVLQIMQQLATEGRTMIVVTHEIKFAKNVCDTAVFLKYGKIHEINSSQEFFENPKTPELKQFLQKS